MATITKTKDIKSELKNIIDLLAEQQALILYGYLQRMLDEDFDILTEEDIEEIKLAEEEIAKGEYVEWTPEMFTK